MIRTLLLRGEGGYGKQSCGSVQIENRVVGLSSCELDLGFEAPLDARELTLAIII